MKRNGTKAKSAKDSMRPEYDFSGGVRGKYVRRYQESSNVVVLDPDIAARFKNARAVNEALRALVKIAEQAGA